ncbi:trehalose 6-phosphatase [Noviherbaspirillum humi]|uniref:Trehalose 6-phosphate phosphatase n=1 Tax=Noviherbaspirillum humi TaxID=1688639 RepID=A0A239HCY8_9BURK|nr:trehalose-phosphatase [Noviherbaspirillum humi]SNS79021.1 trehalose 6-phosphatase [Noviherbaspirillum humi]
MTDFFTEAGLARLAHSVPRRLLCAFDFDGTLAPIVSEPDAAALPPAVQALLQRLLELAPVAVITGRSLQDIDARLGFDPDFVIGNHGIEGTPNWQESAAMFRRAAQNWREQLSTLLEQGPLPGCRLEDKAYSLSVHYREAPDAVAAERTLRALFARLDPPPRVVAGKFVFNLVHDDAPHKGDALERLIELTGAEAALYVGDDVTDEDVFRLQRPDILSIRVEPHADTAAHAWIASQRDIARLLAQVISLLERQGARNWLRHAGKHPE